MIIILLGLYLAAVAAGSIYGHFVPAETQIRRASGCDEILLQSGAYALVKLPDEDNKLYFIAISSRRFLFIRMPARVVHETVFDLDSRTVVGNKTWFDGDFDNEYVNEARKKYYGYRIYGEVTGGAPLYNFYMGISDVEPSYERLGDRVHELQYAEVDEGLYAFMFIEDFKR